MSSNQFWLGFWGILITGAFALSVLVSVIVSLGHYREINAIEQMVADGIDPISAACSLKMRGRGWVDECLLLEALRKN